MTKNGAGMGEVRRKQSEVKTMRKIIKLGIGILLVAGLIAAVYASFALILISSDHAYYSASGKNLGEIDYENAASNAKKAGYTVDGPFYVSTKQKIGLHPSEDIRDLDERLGEDYRMHLAKFYYTEDSFFEAILPGGYGGETSIHFFNESKDLFAPFEVTHLPPDSWITEKLKLMFGFDEQKAQYYLSQLKDSINRDHKPKILIEETPNLLAVYTTFKETSSNSSFSLPVGEGWCKETFYSGNKKTGAIDYLVPNVRIIHRDKGQEYTIKIDRLGGVYLNIKLDVGEQIPEEEYRGVFRDMFVDLGLPSKRVDEFEFEYVPTIW
ncbi:MAG: hypothetical protein WBD09_05570 [Halobacteriota archaeon]